MPIRRIAPSQSSAPAEASVTAHLDNVTSDLDQPQTQSQPLPQADVTTSRRRGHATRDERGKFEPAGDYQVGFARPPAQHRFAKGNRGGPGRPKRSISHDAMLRKELAQKRPVRIDGKSQILTLRELLLKTAVKDALAGDKQARRLLLAELARLYPADRENLHGPSTAELNASDALSLAELEAMLLGAHADMQTAGRDPQDHGEGSDQPLEGDTT